MKYIVIFLLLPRIAFAECLWSTGITETPDGYLYSSECHTRVGKLVQDLDDYKLMNKEYDKLLEIKEETIKTHSDRAELWKKTSSELESKLKYIETLKNTHQWLFFGIGAITMSIATWGASQLIKE